MSQLFASGGQNIGVSASTSVLPMNIQDWFPLGWTSCWEKYQQPQICRWYYSSGRKWRGTKDPLNEGKRGEWKSWFKTQHSKNWDHGIWPHHFMGNRWGNSGNRVWLCIFWAPKSLQMVTAAMKLKNAYSLEGKLCPTSIAYSKAETLLCQQRSVFVKAMVLPVVMYGCERWTIKKAEHQRIDAFEL